MLNLDEIIEQSKVARVRHQSMYPILTEYCALIGGSRGLLYVGANTGDELPFCKTITDKIYAFEPVSTDSVWTQLKRHEDEKTLCLNYALSDIESESVMYLASNNYQSSSLFEPGTHINEFPDVLFRSQVKVHTKRLDSFKFVKDCDVIVMDVQGAELNVLNGLTDYTNIKLIIAEFCQHGMYKDACTFDDIQAKLCALGFTFQEVYGIHRGSRFAGNAVFIKLAQ